MISHKHKCIFVHVPKAAGTSIERAFMEDLHLDMENRHALLLGVNTNNTGPRRISHLTASEFVEQHFVSKELFDQYYKFAFVRNPFTRLFSTYKYLYYNRYISFDFFVLHKLEKLLATKEHGYFLKPQHTYLCDNNDEVLVNFIGKLENSSEDFNKVKHAIGFPNLVLSHYNKTNKLNALNLVTLLKRILKEDGKTILNLNFNREKKFKLSKNAINKIISIYSKDFLLFEYSTNP